MRLYNLTPAHFGLSAIALRRLKIARLSELNDPFELLAVNLADRSHRQAFCDLKNQLNKTKGLLCFSSSWSNPVLWGHYADRHMGLALGFDVPDDLPSEAIYADEPTLIPLDHLTNQPSLDEQLINRLLRTKFADWKYEQEWRMFVQLDPSCVEGGLYFYDFSPNLQLVEVILGSRCAIPAAKVSALVADIHPEVVVRKAGIAFQSFTVVEDKLAL
jgi:Protein of unknown function (DUF2971)